MRPQIRSDWTPERLELCMKHGNFTVIVSPNQELASSGFLLDDDIDRLLPKLELVAEIASKLANNMLKGTMKYESDDYDPSVWMEELLDDAADTLNYVYLLRKAQRESTVR